jgi:hypothetical protein
VRLQCRDATRRCTAAKRDVRSTLLSSRHGKVFHTSAFVQRARRRSDRSPSPGSVWKAISSGIFAFCRCYGSSNQITGSQSGHAIGKPRLIANGKTDCYLAIVLLADLSAMLTGDLPGMVALWGKPMSPIIRAVTGPPPFMRGARPDRKRAPSALRLTKRLVPEGIKGTGAWCKHATAPSPRPVAPRFCTAPASSTPCNHQGSARSTWSCPCFTGHSSGGCCLSCDKLAWRAHLRP